MAQETGVCGMATLTKQIYLFQVSPSHPYQFSFQSEIEAGTGPVPNYKKGLWQFSVEKAAAGAHLINLVHRM